MPEVRLRGLLPARWGLSSRHRKELQSGLPYVSSSFSSSRSGCQHDERLARLDAQAGRDSRTSSRPPSSYPPKTRAQRRAEARARAKELMPRGRGAQGWRSVWASGYGSGVAARGST